MKKNIMSCLLAAVCLLALSPGGARAAEPVVNESVLRGSDQYGNTNTETGLGDLTADAVRAWCGAEIALLPSGDFGVNLQPGPVTEEALAACLPRNSELAAAELTAEGLYRLLEHGASRLTLRPDSTIDREASEFGGYLQISGLKVIYDAAAPVGERVYALSLEDGTPVERTDSTVRFRTASTVELLTGGWGYPAVPAERLERCGTELEALSAWVRELGTIAEPEPGRVELYGARDWLVDSRPVILLVLAAVCLLVAQVTRRNRRADQWRTSHTATAEEAEDYLQGNEGNRCSDISSSGSCC